MIPIAVSFILSFSNSPSGGFAVSDISSWRSALFAISNAAYALVISLSNFLADTLPA